MVKKYKVGLIGAGGVTELHLEGYKDQTDRVEVVAICDSNSEILKERADKYGIPQRFTSLEDFIQFSNVDVAIVCTPTSIRKDIVFPLIEAGLPVFVEKPFSDSLEEATEIVNKANQHKIPISVNQNFRRHYPFELVRRIVEEGVIGSVNQIIFNEIFFRQDQGWRLNCERHAMSVMGIHWFDGFRLILDSAPKSIACLTRSASVINCVGETEATVQIAFENDSIVTYVQSFSSTYGKNEMIVIGEKGTLICNHTSVKLYQKGEREPVQTWENKVSREEATFEGLNQLLTSLETGIEAKNSAIDNLKTVSLLDAAYLAANENRIVTFKQGALI
ncbi:Gfo/Idh/MocA family protein [Litchfieldia alkalitelluris]|uniref:Gfo/Idh/MocA family protein n=1 Tax=Litchfieldia alkalitelluris TaxID=304268 RepID=UPI000997E810|nr:Gfo/Idh/MocA family oxidoreductase [Litchfieldia alkalitelluris]